MLQIVHGAEGFLVLEIKLCILWTIFIEAKLPNIFQFPTKYTNLFVMIKILIYRLLNYMNFFNAGNVTIIIAILIILYAIFNFFLH